jgi:lipopolysaccharide transport system ATP-binding protein
MSITASIALSEVFVDFPVFNALSRSIKHRMIHTATGGILDKKNDGVVIVRSLQNINLKIAQGERVGVVGHNGSGKTTLLRVISGIYHPTRGKAILTGECTSLINISLGIDPEATGRENIRLRSAMMGLTPAQSRERIDEIISFSGLGDFIEMPFRTYSSGMQLRLAFAVSTSINPQILVMDEWLSMGDQDFKERAEARLNKVVNSTEILVIASHSRDLLRRNCNRLVWLEHGAIKMDGPADEVIAAYFR